MDTMKRLEDLLCSRSMSLRSIAQLSDVSYSTLKTARQKHTQLSVDTIEELCRPLGITLWEFFMEDNINTSGKQMNK